MASEVKSLFCTAGGIGMAGVSTQPSEKRIDEILENRVATHYEALGYKVTRNINLVNHQIDILATKHVPGANLINLMIEVKHRSSKQVGINDVTPFVNTATNLINNMKISGAVMVTDAGRYSQDASGAVAHSPNIRLLTVTELERELFNESESLIRVCKDYELLPIFSTYVPVRGAVGVIRGDKFEQQGESDDIASYVQSWAVRATSILILLGDFGSGKTTVLEQVFYKCSKRRFDGSDGRLPIFLKLRTFRHHPDIWSFVSTSLRDNQYINPPRELFNTYLASGRLFLIMDGFDEIYTGANAEERGYYLAKLAPLLGSRSPCVLSTRQTYFESFSTMLVAFHASLDRPPKFDRVSRNDVDLTKFLAQIKLRSSHRDISPSNPTNMVIIKDLGQESIMQYLEHHSKELARATGKNVTEIQQSLYKIYDLEDLMKRPLLLNMIVETILAGGVDLTKPDIGIGPALLYDMYTQAAAARDIKKAPQNQFLLETERLAACRQIALEMWHKGSILLDSLDVRSAIKDASLPTVTSSDQLNAAVERAETDIRVCSFLRHDDNGSLSFTHKSFYEFFVAQSIYLAIKSDLSNVSRVATTQLTKEILYFLASFARDQDDFAEIVSRLLHGHPARARRINIDTPVRELLARIAFGSGKLLEKISLPKGVIREVELKKIYLDAVHIRDVNFVGVGIQQVDGLGWVVEDCNWRNSDIKSSRFEDCQFRITMDNTELEEVEYHRGAFAVNGRDWRMRSMTADRCIVSINGSGRMLDVEFTGCPEVCIGLRAEFQTGTVVQFSGCAVYTAGFNSWFGAQTQLRFVDCFFRGLWLDQVLLEPIPNNMLARGVEGPRFSKACRGVVFVRKTEAMNVWEKNEWQHPDIYFVDGPKFKKGLQILRKGRAAEDFATRTFNEEVFEMAEVDTNEAGYVQEVWQEIKRRGWERDVQATGVFANVRLGFQ
jgi:hypothetical protein